MWKVKAQNRVNIIIIYILSKETLERVRKFDAFFCVIKLFAIVCIVKLNVEFDLHEL